MLRLVAAGANPRFAVPDVDPSPLAPPAAAAQPVRPLPDGTGSAAPAGAAQR
ncbi:hypothetical protein [Actinocatenispora thailandica]|uniref:hypothetical protein n=1 Tax=Actinocatenispora thailandica TaxID=227318 RepID=UPI00194E9CF5|nr:hypothetical protein [Actinocatenispora thailandica]